MTFFDLQPIDPYEARFKLVATLVLLSELGVIEDRETHSEKASERSRESRALLVCLSQRSKLR